MRHLMAEAIAQVDPVPPVNSSAPGAQSVHDGAAGMNAIALTPILKNLPPCSFPPGRFSGRTPDRTGE